MTALPELELLLGELSSLGSKNGILLPSFTALIRALFSAIFKG